MNAAIAGGIRPFAGLRARRDFGMVNATSDQGTGTMRMRSWVWVLLLAGVGTTSARGQALSSQLNELVRGANLGQTTYAFCVIDIDDRQMLANVGADRPMVPASNMKLVTTAAALSILGPDFVFTTELGLVEPAEPGRGARLIVVGDGDPAFGDPVLLQQHGYRVDDLLAQWVEAVKRTKQTHFAELLIDDRVFDHVFVHPSWEVGDQVNISGAQVAGINFFRNGLNVSVVPTSPGHTPVITLFPPAPFLPVTNRAVTGSRDDLRKDRRMGTNQISFSGQVRNRTRTPHFIAIHDPPVVFAEVLRHQLAEAGITVGAVRRLNDDEQTPDFQPIHRYTTTLELVLNRTNRDSQNMFAESLFKRAGRAFTGEPGSWDNGAAAIRQFLHDKLGTAASAIVIADGSGLSRDNRATAQLLAELLVEMAHDRRLAAMYRDSLARGDTSGTLANRFRDFDAQVYGKSGYLRGVSALSGYLTVPAAGPRPARHFAYSFLFNDYKAPTTNSDIKALQERMLQQVVDGVAKGSL